MKVLLTSFEPFAEEPLNSSLEAVRLLDETISGAKIVKAELPTVFGKAFETLRDVIEKEQPDVTICTGLAKSACAITIERVAINFIDSRIPDNAGKQPVDEPIFKAGPDAYFTNLPVRAMVEEMKNNKIPAIISYSAGTFVCNYSMYGVLYLIDKQYPNMRGGFIHVPYMPEQVLEKEKTPSMALADIVKGLHCAIKAVLEHTEDIKIISGEYG